MKICSFAQSNDKINHSYYIEYENGEKVSCSEEQIEKLWWHWIEAKGANRQDNDEYIIFTYTEPQELDIENLNYFR